MASDNPQACSKNESGITFDQLDLDQVIFNSYDAIFVTDKFGNVLLANPSSGKLLGVKTEELVGNNVGDLVKKGTYDRSTTLEAIETRSVVTGLIVSWHGVNIMATSTPLMDKNGEITMVITNARDKDLVDKFLSVLEEERKTADRYKTAVEYFSEGDLDPKATVAESQQMRQIIATSNVIAKTDSTVLLLGESGTGKEVIARHIYRNSLRAREPFIPVNCAAIPHELLESEFFGYVRGAFTGASSQGKPGLFEIADKGTLFLDEIAELPLAMQSKILRVLETGEIQRLGGTTLQKTNVRLIAATNRDLKTMINQKLFRSDLYYRLSVIPINLPPLRERPEDILVLAQKFLEELNRKYALTKKFTTQTKQAFLNYSWPGNVRELRNVIERLVITSKDDNLNFEDNTPLSGKTNTKTADRLYRGTLKSVVKAVEKEYINQVLSECDGRVGEAARRLGIHRTLLYRKMRKDK